MHNENSFTQHLTKDSIQDVARIVHPFRQRPKHLNRAWRPHSSAIHVKVKQQTLRRLRTLSDILDIRYLCKPVIDETL